MYLYTDRKKKHVYRDNTKLNTSVSLIERQKKKKKNKQKKKLERSLPTGSFFLSNTVR